MKIAVAGDGAFIAHGQDAPSEMIGVSDPANCRLLGAVRGQACAATRRGGIAYVMTTPGLEIFDVGGARQPRELGAFLEPFLATFRSMSVSGSFVFGEDNTDALTVY